MNQTIAIRIVNMFNIVIFMTIVVCHYELDLVTFFKDKMKLMRRMSAK